MIIDKYPKVMPRLIESMRLKKKSIISFHKGLHIIIDFAEMWNIFTFLFRTQDSGLRTQAEFIQHEYIQYYYSSGIHKYVNIG